MTNAEIATTITSNCIHCQELTTGTFFCPCDLIHPICPKCEATLCLDCAYISPDFN